MPTNSTVDPSACDAIAPATTFRRVAYQTSSSPAWYAVRVRSNTEFRVRDRMNAAGIAEYLPTYDETVRWTDRTKLVTRPLFPGYIFVRIDRFLAAAEVLATAAVIQILGANELSSIPDHVIADLRRVVESPAPVACCPYVAGVRVRVKRGPWTGMIGVVERTRGATLLWIPIEILGRSVSVPIDTADVEKEK
jgi:transcription antitermination factor NusG